MDISRVEIIALGAALNNLLSKLMELTGGQDGLFGNEYNAERRRERGGG